MIRRGRRRKQKRRRGRSRRRRMRRFGNCCLKNFEPVQIMTGWVWGRGGGGGSRLVRAAHLWHR